MLLRIFLIISQLSAMAYSMSHGKIMESLPDGPWNLPVLPLVLPDPITYAVRNTTWANRPQGTSNGKNDSQVYGIPRHLWMAIKDVSDGLNYQLPMLFERNPLWEIHVATNEEKDLFMNTTFANTSILWAYHRIHHEAGAAKADIWRYCVLYTYGGVYIDDDSDMKKSLDEVIHPEDQMIVAIEQNGFDADVCYVPRYHLSDVRTYANESYRKLDIFQQRILLNWAIFSAPRHPILKRTLENVVEVIRHEYFGDAVLRHLKGAFRWNLVMCSTGPSIFTASAREMVLEHLIENKHDSLVYKVADVDFKEYGGKFKAVYTRVKDNPSHYMNMHKKKGMGLLETYHSHNHAIPKTILLSWEKEAVMSQNGKQIYVMENGLKRGIQNFETFLALNYTLSSVRVVSDDKLNGIPNGEPMPLMKLP